MNETAKTKSNRLPNAVESFRRSATAALSGGSLIDVALSIALIEYPQVDHRKYADWFDRLGREISETLPASASIEAKVSALNRKLFDEMGFAGNINNYFDPRNSFLNMVIDRRLGIPITLSVLYIELGKRIGLELGGIGLPGHFIVGCMTPSNLETADFFVDPFHGGRIMDEVDCAGMVQTLYGGRIPFQDAYTRPMAPRDIILRMINNLKAIYAEAKLYDRLLKLQEMVLILDPRDRSALRDRGEIKFKLGDYRGAGQDLDSFINDSGGETVDDSAKSMANTCKSNLASLN